MPDGKKKTPDSQRRKSHGSKAGSKKRRSNNNKSFDLSSSSKRRSTLSPNVSVLSPPGSIRTSKAGADITSGNLGNGNVIGGHASPQLDVQVTPETVNARVSKDAVNEENKVISVQDSATKDDQINKAGTESVEVSNGDRKSVGTDEGKSKGCVEVTEEKPSGGDDFLLDADALDLLANLTPSPWHPQKSLHKTSLSKSRGGSSVKSKGSDRSSLTPLFSDEMDSTNEFMNAFSTQRALIEQSASPELKRTSDPPSPREEDVSSSDESLLPASAFERSVCLAANQSDTCRDLGFPGKEENLDNAISESALNAMELSFNESDSVLHQNEVPKENPGCKSSVAIEGDSLTFTMLEKALECDFVESNAKLEHDADVCETSSLVHKPSRHKRHGSSPVATCSPPKQSCPSNNTSDCVPPTPPGGSSGSSGEERVKTPLIGGANGATPTRALRSTRKKKGKTPRQAESTPVKKSQLATQETFTIIDVAADKTLFKHFLREWKGRSWFAVSLACDKAPEENTCVIGNNFRHKGWSRPHVLFVKVFSTCFPLCCL